MPALQSLFVLFLFAVNFVTALDLGVGISPALVGRSINAAGGWASNVDAINGTCPAESTFCFAGCCCPGALTCVATNDPVNCVCCPGGSSCETTFQRDPVCANTSWTLWNATDQGQYGGFFCCDYDQIGAEDGGCWPPGTEPDVRAMSLSSGTQNTVHLANKVKLSKKVIIGIVVGCGVVFVLFVLAAGCCCWKCCCKKRRNKKQEGFNQTYEPYRSQ